MEAMKQNSLDWFEIPGSENEVSVGVTLIKSIIITQAKCAGAV